MQNGTIDIECGSTTNNATRQKDVSFANTTFVEEVRMAVKADSNIKSIADLKGKTVATTTGTRPLVSDPELSSPGRITIAIRAKDPILDAIAFSRGRFAFDLAGNAPLYLPSWPEVSRVIEDCR